MFQKASHPASCSSQVQLHEVAQDLIWLSLENVWKQNFHNLPGQSAQVFHHLHGENI